MPDNFHGADPKTIWQNQSTETSTMTLEKIRQKTLELHAKTRRQMLGMLTVPLVIALFYAFTIKQFPSVREVLHPLFAFALVWSLAGLYFMNRGKRPEAMPGDAGFSAGLEFCRKEIERRRDFFHGALLWLFGPVILTIGTFVLALAMTTGRQIFPNAMPFLMLVVAWVAAYFILRVREQRELQRAIDELHIIERENGRS